MRRIALGVVLLAIWLGMFAWSADLPWNAPVLPHRHISMDAEGLRAHVGSGKPVVGGFAVNALGDDGMGLQTLALNYLKAKDFSVLTYRIDGFSDRLELALVFRRADTPDDVQTISIPVSRGGEISVDLSAFPDWHGEITEIGFAQYATAQLVPPSMATFKPFRIEHFELQSPAWSQVFSRLRSDWFGYRPWALKSINTLGPQNETLQNSSMQPALAAGGLLSIIAFWTILRPSRRRLVQTALLAAIGIWILLDLRWLDDFAAKHAVSEDLLADKSFSERMLLQPDEDTLAAANKVSQIAHAQSLKRILVLSDSSYTHLRLVYFLLPLNATPMEQALGEAPGVALPRDALIVAYASEWTFDEGSGSLSHGAAHFPVTQLYTQGDLRVYRPREVQP